MSSHHMRYVNLDALGQWPPAEGDAEPADLPLLVNGLLQVAAQEPLNRDFQAAKDTASLMPLCYRRLVQELSSIGVIMRLERLSGCERLLPDVHLVGGGCTAPSYATSSWPDQHPQTGLERALTLAVCLQGADKHIQPGAGVLILAANAVSDDVCDRAFVIHYYFSPMSSQ